MASGAGRLDARLVLTTAPDLEAARGLVRALVEARACACGTVLSGALSIYRWQGRIEESQECQLLLKCDEASLPRLRELLDELHPYELPELVVVEPREVEERYAAWIAAQCGPEGA